MIQQLTSIPGVLQYTIVLLAIGLLIGNFEYIFNYKIFLSNGILEWKIIKIRWTNLKFKNLLNHIFTKKTIVFIFVLRIILIVLLVALPFPTIASWITLFLLISSYLITNFITFYGSDGSDQMNNLILITLFLCTSPFTNENVVFIGIVFIVAQSCLSYFVAGITKLFSKSWRSGEAVKEIFKTRTYGSEKVYNYIKDRRSLNVFLCWSVILMESLFPLVLLLPIEWALLFLAWGFTFHLLNALIMGLNTFLWAFLATYPAIIFLNLML